MSGKLAGFISLSETTELALEQSDVAVIAADPALPFLIAERSKKAPQLVITHSSSRASEIALQLSELVDQVAEFPAWESLPHERLSPNSDTVARRIDTLISLDKTKVVVTTARALLQPINQEIIEMPMLSIQGGRHQNFSELIQELTHRAYNRVDMVERRGDFAVRGGIIDLFPPLADHPVRIEFFGDDVEEIRNFSVADQRSLEVAPNGLWAPACYEPFLNEEFEPVGKLQMFTDLFPKNSVILISDAEKVKSRAAEVLKTSEEFLNAAWMSASLGGNIPQEVALGGFKDLVDVEKNALKNDLKWWQVSPFIGHVDDEQNFDVVDLKARVLDGFRGDFTAVITELRNKLSLKWKVVIASAGAGSAQRYLEQLSGADLAAKITESELASNLVNIYISDISHGFSLPEQQLLIISDTDIVGMRSSMKDVSKLPTKRKNSIDVLTLVPGDYIVHEQHGVGKYIEMTSRTVGNATREYLVIEYAASKRGLPADRLFVPTDQLDQITKFIGGEIPSLNRLGGIDWEKTKGRARKAVKQIAAELIRLYAARMSAPGFAFSPDSPWQKELEDSFAFVETIDQQATIDEVKRDMEKPNPMDRIVCGDVGYGKTEIAVRAAFKAVQDGKQVAILVPTTLLVQQHFNTFSARYSGFPIKLAALSRFNTPAQSKEVIAGLKTGAIDVVIGTHRLLSKDVIFADLGLLVVDEEQRFGVEHKEELKKARTNVDVLAMSATPIPRTLEMAITGIREMSNITTPPEERHPVLTYVGPYDDKQVSAAINRELLRDGQVFFIHNRVESIEAVAERLKKLVPGVKIGIAHGQMNERALEEVILSFWNRDFDLLLCTTIIESGIDIPNANTLIVDRSDLFGLSQLHQLRGRVGRSRERAYAYFLYPTEQPITELAHDRLTTIATNTDLGAGMQVALKDLEIRGAGNLLGGEQSGHIAEVGFDLYMRMVADAVEEFKTGYFDEKPKNNECKVELPVNAHLPVEYIESERLRLDLYRRIADAHNDEDLSEISAELVDRFGPIPKPAQELMAVASLRLFAKSLGLTDIAISGKNLRLSPVYLPESAQIKLTRLYPGSIYKNASQILLVARPVSPNWIESASVGDTSTLAWVNSVLQELIQPLKPSSST